MPNNEPIHSGHFMTSNPHTEIVVEDEDEEIEVDVVDVDNTPEVPLIEKQSLHEGHTKVLCLNEDEKPVTFYKFGPKKTQTIAIDVSLGKLNKCIKVAYMKMTTPKWKDFKGLKLQWKHRIRLNNVIWRAYYMEFRKPDKRKKTPTCYFAVPDDDTTHSKIEGTVIEGMYWKRRMEAICAQYKKWRTYNRHAKKKKCWKKSCECEDEASQIRPQQSQTPQNMSTFDDYFAYEDLDNEFTNSLFDSLNAPFLFPNTKEIMQGSNADIIQPGLLSLQPSLEEIMLVDEDTNLDSLEPTFSIQQPHTSNNSQMINGRSSGYSFNNFVAPTINSSNKLVDRSKNYLSNVIDYNQPTRQPSSIPANGPMTSNLSQPLYSQAVYETRATSAGNNLNDSPVVGLDIKTAPRNASLSTTLDYVPQLLVSANIGQTAQNNLHTFTSMVGQQNSMISPHQWWMNNQIYNSPEEKALQILRSPVSQAMSQTPNALQTTMLLGLSQANQGLQQSSTYPNNSYGFSTTTFKSNNIQQMPQEAAISQTHQQLQMHLNQRQHQPQNPFQIQTTRQQLPQISGINTTQSFNQRQDLSHYLPQNGNNISTPSASLASILTARPRSNQELAPQQNLDIKRESLQSELKQKAVNSNRWGANKSSLIQTIAGTSDGLTAQTSQLDRNAYATTNLKAPKTPTPVGGYRRKNGRQQNPLSPSDSPSRRTSTRNKRTRSQIMSELSIASTSGSSKKSTLSQPSSVQTQYESEMLSPMDTPQTDGLGSDESFEERSPSVFSLSKRSRYSTPCAEAADSTLNPEERKRLLHLNAEKNRREALKDGFEALVQAIPVIEETGIKVTNAVVLNRAAQHIRNLCKRIDDYDRQIADCEKRHELLQKRVSIVQSSLPSNVHQPSSGQSSSMSGQIMQFFDRYVREKSQKDPLFVVMANMLKPVVETFADQVHGNSADRQQLRNSVINWSEENFKVGRLRPLASQTLIKIATETNLINVNPNGAPTNLQDYVVREVNKLSEYNDNI